jgi:hypothetical protein
MKDESFDRTRRCASFRKQFRPDVVRAVLSRRAIEESCLASVCPERSSTEEGPLRRRELRRAVIGRISGFGGAENERFAADPTVSVKPAASGQAAIIEPRLNPPIWDSTARRGLSSLRFFRGFARRGGWHYACQPRVLHREQWLRNRNSSDPLRSPHSRSSQGAPD